MKVYVLYHPRSDHARIVEDFIRDFKRIQGKDIEVLSLETRDGAATASLYDITEYPAILALREDGQLLKFWQGNQLPLMQEVSAYVAV
jgi:hypothetical protein